MDIKSFWSSKMNWLGLATICLGLLEMSQYVSFVSSNPVIMSGIGFAIVILRTYFVKTTVAGPVASITGPSIEK